MDILFEEEVSEVVDTILYSAMATYDNVWMVSYLDATQHVTDKTDRMRLRYGFSEKIHLMRQIGVLKADAKSVRSKAEEIVQNNPSENRYGLASQYGDSLITKS